MSAPEMFGGPIPNFGESQNPRSTQIAIQREESPQSPALDLKCYGTPKQSATTVTTSVSPLGQNSCSILVNHTSPPTVVDSPSPTERPATPVEPENLSTVSEKELQQQRQTHQHSSSTGAAAIPSSREIMDTGRSTPMRTRDYMLSAHPESSTLHPPPSMLGSSSLYPPFSTVRPGSFYPIEHYFPHPGSQGMSEGRHALPPPPIAKTPPR